MCTHNRIRGQCADCGKQKWKAWGTICEQRRLQRQRRACKGGAGRVVGPAVGAVTEGKQAGHVY